MSERGAAPRRGDYNSEVRSRFRRPAHGGELPPDAAGAGQIVSAVISEGGAGAQIRLTGVTDGERWVCLRYRIFGCPHLVAAAEAAAERFEGGPVQAVRTFPVEAFMKKFGVPVEKTGRILLLEDAFLELDAQRAQALENTA